jgi:hypothetical protein
MRLTGRSPGRPTARAAALTIVLAAAAALVPPMAQACDASRHQDAARAKATQAAAPWVLGDSTMYFSVPELAALGLEADARGCRTFDAGLELLAARNQAGTLPPLIVFALGANGGAARWQLDTAVFAAGPNRVVGLVTPRNDPGAAQRMREAAARFPRRVILMDWVAFSAGHPEWFGDDGLHVGAAGAQRFARFIHGRAEPVMPPPARKLGLPRSTVGATPCGALGPRLGGAEVFIVRGASRVGCPEARRLAGTSPLRRISSWHGYAWGDVHRGPWRAVYARGRGRVLVATRSPATRSAPPMFSPRGRPPSGA